MGIFQGDVILKAAIELGLDDMRKNVWILDHALESMKLTPFIADKYGQKQIDAAREWFLNNQIDIYMRPRNDEDRMPCITIYPGGSEEAAEMKTTADTSTETITLQPNQIGKQIPYVIKPFTPDGYVESTGELFVPNGLVGFETVSEGMVLVDPSTGNGYKIIGKEPDALLVEPGTEIDATQLAVVPQFPYFKANIEHTWCDEIYTIGCHSHGDPQVLLWLHTIVLYTLFRYRESLLEANGFVESIFRSGELYQDEGYEGPNGEQAFVRVITISGKVEQTWIKAPRRFVESVGLKDENGNSGVQILSNLDAPQTIDKTNENWYTVDEKKNP